MEWFKFYGSEYLSDPKTRNFTAEQHSCWLHLLCFASNSTILGVLEHLTEEQLMIYAGIKQNTQEWSKTRGILQIFEVRKMVKLSDGKVTVCNWDKRQQSYMSGAERQRRYRERLKVTAPLRNVTSQSDAREKRREEKERKEEFSKENGEENAKMLKNLESAKKKLQVNKIIKP